MKVLFFTVHDAASSRKVDFHFWAEELNSRGIDVDFVTVGFSPFTNFKRGGRRYSGPYNQWENVTAKILANGKKGQNFGETRRYLWRAPFHPVGLGDFFNKILDPLFSLYPWLIPAKLLSGIKDSDICIVENGAGLLLVPRLKKLLPNARFIYNVCDRIETLGYHPSIVRAEKASLPLFDQIRVPAQIMVGDFGPFQTKATYIPHGLQKEAFNNNNASPYSGGKNAVSVGDMLFDAFTIEQLAKNFPDWTFHLFGRKAKISHSIPNVVTHGEQPFDRIVPYIQHADIGIAPYHLASGADYLSQSSMKMIQYTYCRLPILAPNFAASGRDHVCGYEPGNSQTIRDAMNAAIQYDRSKIDPSSVMGWAEMVDELLSEKTQ